jgi:hypothetical protein
MKMIAIGLGALILGLSAPGANAQESCDSLWYARNSIYKDAGYCFKTSRGIREFGNAGCAYDDVNDVPLSSRDTREVQRIVRMEKRMGCKG